MKTVSFETIMSWKPCLAFPEVRIKRLMRGRKALSVADILRMRSITRRDKLWAVLRNEFFGDRELRLMACDFAERVLPMFEAKYPDDNRPRKAIEVSRRFAVDEATAEELECARSAARSAAGYAAWCAAMCAVYAAKSAACRAAEAASRRAARRAARYAVRSAAESAARSAWDAEQKEQIKIIKSYMEGDDEG